MNKLIAGAMTTVAVGAMVPLLAAAPANADAQAKVCKPGSVKLVWQGVAKQPTVTHAKQYRNGTGKTVQVSAKVREVVSVRSAVKGAVKPATVLASLEKQTKLKLAPAGQKTPATVLVKAKVKPGKAVLFGGTVKASGVYAAKTCNKTGTAYGKVQKGSAVSWTKVVTGAIGCGDKTVNPIAAAAQKKYC